MNFLLKSVNYRFITYSDSNVASADFSKRYKYSMHISSTDSIAFMLKFAGICRTILIEK
jgi:hypothetical protein